MTTISDIRAILPKLEEEGTGGNCSGLVYRFDDGGHLLHTVGEGYVPEDTDAFIDCGVYDAESNLIDEAASLSIDEVQSWIASALKERQSFT
ncbi:hypothetical protein [Peristeroidobacter soli]|uniref:hypothetical protein n=1 Tax=Peristeroidobacter soli TaxID=2497877 RepID=UPI00101DC20D|nr:hypothetical protein [Peristeroidobacter soli]